MEALQRQFMAEIAKNNMEYYRVAPEKVINSLPIDSITLVKDSMWSIRGEYGGKATVKVTFKGGEKEICGGFYEEVSASLPNVDRFTGIITNYSKLEAKIEVACDTLKEILMEQLARDQKFTLDNAERLKNKINKPNQN